MPKVLGVRERHHQPYWDSLIRCDENTAPSPLLTAQMKLFVGAANLGQVWWTNLDTAGQLPSDQTYVILAMRTWLWFHDPSADGSANVQLLYMQCMAQLYFTLYVGPKSQFQAPCWFFPAGGGVWGFDSLTPLSNNGIPSHDAILKLAKPVLIPARQTFYVLAEFHDIGSTSLRTNLNDTTAVGCREIKFVIDGIHTREVL